jgi:putative component of membrane protein insertase Oxa1/YidC/SpoIIIJ protein YidD
MMRHVTNCEKSLASGLLLTLRVYQRVVNPFLHRFSALVGISMACKFPVTCSDYAAEQLKKHHLVDALRQIAKRLWSCSPLSSNRLEEKFK